MKSQKFIRSRNNIQDRPLRAHRREQESREIVWALRATAPQTKPTSITNIPESEEDVDTSTMTEVKEAIQQQPNYKTPGHDGICPEMLLQEVEEIPKLRDLPQNIGCRTNISRMEKVYSLKLPEKDELKDDNNWRAIALLSQTSKIFSLIIQKRLPNVPVRQEQSSFTNRKSWNLRLKADYRTKHMMGSEHCVHWLSESIWQHEPRVIVENHELLWILIENKKIYKKNKNIFIVGWLVATATNYVSISTGFKQGGVLSTFIFILGMDWVMRQQQKKGK